MRNRIPIAMLSVLAALPALAATDGTLGSTSTGTLNITATVPAPEVPAGTRITGLRDISVGNYSGSGSTGLFEIPVCIFHSTPEVGITLRQPGREIGDGLQLAGPDGWRLKLEFGYRLPSGFGWLWSATEAGGPGATFNRESETCTTGPMGALQGRIVGAMDVQGRDGVAPPGNYNGVIQLLIWTL